MPPEEIGFFAHGTTVTTNALLESKGNPVGLLINDGYGAITEVQTQARDEGNPFDHLFAKPAHIAPPETTRGIGGRIDYLGNELAPLDEDAVARAATELAAKGISSFAACYLFAFMNDAHERRTAEIIRDVAPDSFVSLSSEVLPRIREWPRYSTTLVNAYLVGVLARYIADLAAGLDARGATTRRRFLMQSNGGVMPLSANAESQTVHTLLSGPAAGVQGTAYLLGIQQGIRNIVTMDMGGTSCDIAFIQDGAPLEHAEAIIASRIVAVPALDVATISAGGGSIARVNAAGLLEVGPDSAGADPGPACYGKGGDLPTVTDADLVAGALNPDFFLGGRVSLDLVASKSAIRARVAEPMNADLRTAASGIQRVVNARMADEIRVQAAKKESTWPVSRWCRSAVRARSMPRQWRRISGFRVCWCRAIPARSPPSDCCALTWCTIMSARICATLPGSIRRMSKTPMGRLKRVPWKNFPAKGCRVRNICSCERSICVMPVRGTSCVCRWKG